jgi:hypothetical protein
MKWKKLIRKMVSSQLINQAFRPPSFLKKNSFYLSEENHTLLIFFSHQIRKYSGHPNHSLNLLECITFPNAAEKIIQTNVVGLHKSNCPLIFIDLMEENDCRHAMHISAAGPEVSRK